MKYQKKQMKWFAIDEKGTIGPLSYDDLEFRYRSGELSKNGSVRCSTDDHWIPVSEFFSGSGTSFDNESQGLIPKGADMIFLLGLFSFFVGVGLFFFINWIGYIFLIISSVFEFGSIYYSHKYEAKSIAKNIGNIFALLWAIFQGVITLCIIIFSLI